MLQTVETVAYLFGQEKTLGELSAKDRGDARLSSGDWAVGCAYIKPPTTRDWRGRVLLTKQKKGGQQVGVGFVSVEMSWQQRKLPLSEVLENRYLINFAGMGVSIMSPLTTSSEVAQMEKGASAAAESSEDEDEDENTQSKEDRVAQLTEHTPGDEFMYLSILGVQAKADQYKDGKLACNVRVKRFQLDNQRADAANATLFSRTQEVPIDKPMLQMQVIKLPHDCRTTFELVEILLQALELKLDLSFVFHLLDFLQAIDYDAGVQDEADEDSELQRVEASSSHAMLKDIFYCGDERRAGEDASELGADLYFGRLNLFPIKLKLSFSMNSDMPLSRVLPSLESNALLQPVAVVIMSASSFLANIDEAQLSLNCLDVQHLLGSQQFIQNIVTQHFTNQVTLQKNREHNALDFAVIYYFIFVVVAVVLLLLLLMLFLFLCVCAGQNRLVVCL